MFTDLCYPTVVSGLQQQLEELQKTLDCLQESDKNLRLALKMGEMKNKETEIKLQLTSDRCLRLEQRNRRLDHKYRLLLRQHRDLEKHLQKKAVLNQMVEQPSPGVSVSDTTVCLVPEFPITKHYFLFSIIEVTSTALSERTHTQSIIRVQYLKVINSECSHLTCEGGKTWQH